MKNIWNLEHFHKWNFRLACEMFTWALYEIPNSYVKWTGRKFYSWNLVRNMYFIYEMEKSHMKINFTYVISFSYVKLILNFVWTNWANLFSNRLFRKDGAPRKSEDLTPTICHISEYGNTTVYQWRTGNVPTVSKLRNVVSLLYLLR